MSHIYVAFVLVRTYRIVVLCIPILHTAYCHVIIYILYNGMHCVENTPGIRRNIGTGMRIYSMKYGNANIDNTTNNENNSWCIYIKWYWDVKLTLRQISVLRSMTVFSRLSVPTLLRLISSFLILS